MAFYEFACPDCKSCFGLSMENELDFSQLFCVECGSPEIILTAYDQELSLRIASLVDSVNELTDRVKLLEFENDIGSDTSSKKSTDEAN